MVRSKVLDVAQGNLDMTFAIANEDDFGRKFILLVSA